MGDAVCIPWIERHDAVEKWTGEYMTYKITVVIEKNEDGYYAYAPEFEGCQSQGDTLNEVLANIREAVELYWETIMQASNKEE
jgi:predicted RNase H-like HicB family nuclease